MKKLLGIILAAVLLATALSVAVFAADAVAYVAYNKGNDKNDGMSVATPKRNVGLEGENGAFDIVIDGGTIVVTEKMYFGGNYTWSANAPVTITAKYGGRNYVNPTPATNPSTGSFKIKPDSMFNITSDLTFDNIILFSEGAVDTFVVKDGATLTVTDTVLSMSKTSKNFHIRVEKGGKAVINGGIFSSVSGEGEIVIGAAAVVESTTAPGGADTVAYINYNAGKNSFDGLSDATAKKSFGSKSSDGACSLLSFGGTLVFSEKALIESNYTWKVSGSTVFTAKNGDKSYLNTQIDSKGGPTSGVLKFNKGCTFTIASDLTVEDMVLFHEGNATCTFLVTDGATLTIKESALTMSTSDKYIKIIVNAGATAVIEGGTYHSVTGGGKITLGKNVKVLKTAEEVGAANENVCFLDYKKGDNNNDGTSAATAVKGYGAGVFKKLPQGGTVVLSGDAVIGGTNNTNTYSMPTLSNPLIFTSVYDGENYKDVANFLINKDIEFIISSDVTFDNIVLFDREGGSAIRVKSGATLTVTDTVEFKSNSGSHFTIIVEEGGKAALSATAKATFTVEGDGTVTDYVKSGTKIELTIGSGTAYVNGVAKTLDAAPINRNSRTMLPVRFLAENLGATVEWDDATKTATLKDATTTIAITIGASSMTVNGATVALDSPAIIENSRTYLPLRAIANALGVTNDNISWNDATKTATLVK